MATPENMTPVSLTPEQEQEYNQKSTAAAATTAQPVTLTPEQEQEFNQKSGAVNPIKDFSAQDLFDLSVKDPDNFDLVGEFRKNKDLWGDPAIVQKVADAHNQIKQRGFSLSDIPGPGKIARSVWDVAKGFGKQAWNYGSALIGAPAAELAYPGGAKEVQQEAQRKVAENIAGTEASTFSMAEMAKRAIEKMTRGQPVSPSQAGAQTAVGASKQYSEFSPQEKVQDLFDAVGKGEAESDILRGHGGFMTPVGGEVVKELEEAGKPVRPEEVQQLAAGDPLSFYSFGKAFSGLGMLAKPLAKVGIGAKLAEVAPKVGGKAVELTGEAIQKGAAGAKLGAKVLPAAGAIGGTIKAGPVGTLAGIKGGEIAAKTVAKGAKVAEKAGAAVEQLGQQISGAKPLVSPIAQLGKDVLEATPGAIGEAAKGVALDLGLAAATSETPQETQSVGLGTALGILGGAKKVGGRVLSGQIIAPRPYGVQSPVPSSGNFPALDAMHKAAFGEAEPGVKARLNAVQQFVKGVSPDTDVYLAQDEPSLEAALKQTGVSDTVAKTFSQQNGFFTANLPDANGNLRKVIIARDVDSVPHEAFHAVQDVLGEDGNQAIDALVKQEYQPQWEQEGQKYAQRLGIDLSKNTWEEGILDSTGTGLDLAKEKIYQNFLNKGTAETGAKLDPEFIKTQTASELNRILAEAKQRNPDATMQQIWREVLSPEESKSAADKYLSRELAAENFDAIFKRQGPQLTEHPSLIGKLSQMIGGAVSALGGEPLAGRRTEVGGVEPKFKVVQAVREAAKGIKPISPEEEPPAVGPKPAPPAPIIPPTSPVSEEATAAKKLAEEAPEAPAEKGLKSPRELLGTVAEAIANRGGVKINYASAPDEPAAATTSNRDTRRQIIEAWRIMPQEARALWEKTFFPDKVTKTKEGKYQVQGWAPEVFASNAHKLAGALSKIAESNPNVLRLSPYEIDPETKTFTPDAWKQLFDDTQTFVKNQLAGATGAGEPLVVPKNVTEAGFFAPAAGKTGAKLSQDRADIISMLFGAKIPESVRMQKGKLPLNIAGQEISEATKPGRVEFPVRPRGVFEGPEAEAMGIEGRKIKEVNPVRNALEEAAQKANEPVPSFIEAIQKLNLENIKEVEHAPEVPEFRGNILTLTAGFQPKTEAGKKLEQDGYKFQEIGQPGYRVVTVTKDGKVVGEISAVSKEDPKKADVALVHVEPLERGKNLGETLYREMATALQADGVTELGGTAVNAGPLKIRQKVFGGFEASNPKNFGTFRSVDVTSKIEPTAKFQPADEAMRSLHDEEAWKNIQAHPPGKYGGGLTGWAAELGSEAKTPEDLAAFRSANETFTNLSKEAMKLKDWAKAGDYGTRAQAASEAYQAATGEKPDGTHGGTVDFIRENYDKDYQPPMAAKTEPSAQAQPKTFIIRHGSTDYNDETGKQDRIRGHLDIPLNKEGQQEAKDTAEALKDSGIKRIYASDLGRTMDTALALQEKTGAGVVPTEGLRPWKLGPDIEGHLTKEVLPKIKNLIDNPDEKPKGGESFNEFKDRFLGTYHQIQDAHPDENTAIVTHYRGTKLLDSWRKTGTDNDTVDMADFAAQAKKEPGSFDVVDKEGNLVDKAPQVGETGPSMQAQPKKTKDDYKLLPAGPDGISKSWILPDGKPVQLGGQWHHHWLAESPEGQAAAEKYKLDVPPFEGQDTEGVREAALKKGFARVNYSKNSGTLTVEARAKDWRKQKESVRQMVESNVGDIDNMTVHLLNDSVTKVVDSDSTKLFNYDDQEKLDHLPLISGSEPRAQFAPGKTFSDPQFKDELDKLKSGESSGQTFTSTGAIWTPPADQKLDIVTLANVNVPAKDLSLESVNTALKPYKELLDHPDVVAGIFSFSKNGQPYASIDVNAVVPQEHRDNSVQFARDNDQMSIWDSAKQEEVKTGGSGNAKLTKTPEILEALDNLVAGKPVNVEDIVDQNKSERPEQAGLPGMERLAKKALTTLEMSAMTKADLSKHFPEAVIPRKRDESIPSAIISSPLYKQAGGEDEAVKAFADKLVDFAKEKENTPTFQLGRKWYSDFSTQLKKEFGKDAQLMAELLAATSPNTSVSSNFKYAVDAVDGFKSGRFDKQLKKFNQGMDMIANDNWRSWYNKEVNAGRVPKPPVKPTAATFLEHWINTHDLKPRQSNGTLYGIHSTPVLQVFARKWLDSVKGPKVRNFVENLIGAGHEATIDVWADRTMRRLGYSDFQDRWRILPMNGTGVSDKDFVFSQKAFKAAAEQMNMKPDELQAALWFAEKQLWAENGWAKLSLGDFREEMKKLPELRKQAIVEPRKTK